MEKEGKLKIISREATSEIISGIAKDYEPIKKDVENKIIQSYYLTLKLESTTTEI